MPLRKDAQSEWHLLASGSLCALQAPAMVKMDLSFPSCFKHQQVSEAIGSRVAMPSAVVRPHLLWVAALVMPHTHLQCICIRDQITPAQRSRSSKLSQFAITHCHSGGWYALLACSPHLCAHDADIQRLVALRQAVAVPHVRLAELHGSQRDELWRHEILRVRKPKPFLCARYTGSMCMCSNKCACSASFDCTHTARMSRVSRRASSGGWSTGL